MDHEPPRGATAVNLGVHAHIKETRTQLEKMQAQIEALIERLNLVGNIEMAKAKAKAKKLMEG